MLNKLLFKYYIIFSTITIIIITNFIEQQVIIFHIFCIL